MKSPYLPSGRWLALILLLFVSAVSLRAAPPVVSNVRASQRTGTGLVDIYYDVANADGNKLAINVQVSNNGGVSYNAPVKSLSGDLGQGIVPGNNKHVIWDAGADWDPVYFANVRVKVLADDGFDTAPTQMCYIPAGEFAMGDNYNEGQTSERPVHTVYVSGCYMDKYEVTKQLWDEVYLWAVGHGYAFDNVGSTYGQNHPVQTVNWYDMVNWCNARSEYRALAPVYYADANQTAIYKTGRIDLQNTFVKWSANGYRLPTEAEWEKAARGGLPGNHYPWPSLGGNYASFIDSSKAKYGGGSGTAAVGSYPANGYGLCDMAGNVWEWCWDWYSESWYGQADAIQSNTRGSTSGQWQVLRGGSWLGNSVNLRCAYRSFSSPDTAYVSLGFRCVRGL